MDVVTHHPGVLETGPAQFFEENLRRFPRFEIADLHLVEGVAVEEEVDGVERQGAHVGGHILGDEAAGAGEGLHAEAPFHRVGAGRFPFLPPPRHRQGQLVLSLVADQIEKVAGLQKALQLGRFLGGEGGGQEHKQQPGDAGGGNPWECVLEHGSLSNGFAEPDPDSRKTGSVRR